jgi:cytosol aminopeptidase
MSSTSAYIVPFDHQSYGQIIQGLNPAELWASTRIGEKSSKVGTTRIFYNTPVSKVTVVSSLGENFANKSEDMKRELVRKSVGSAVKDLEAIDSLKDVSIEASIDPHAAGTWLTFSNIH